MTTKPTPQPRRSQASRRAKSGRQMLGAGISLIAANGSRNVSMAEIGIKAGYSRGLAAERFGTKLRLLEAVVDASEAWFDRRLETLLADKSGLEALSDRLVAHMESVLDSSEAATALYQLIVEATGSVTDLQPRITRLNKTYAEGMKIHLQEAQDMGQLRDGVDFDKHALIIVSVMHGLAIQALIRGEAESLPLDSRYAAEVCIAAIARPT